MWIQELFCEEGVAQTILLLTSISLIGLALGRLKFGNVNFGSSFVFFAAILAGHFAGRLGIRTNSAIMDYTKTFGLVIFVYTLGLQCGPGFFTSMRKGGMKLISSALGAILMGTLMTVILVVALGYNTPEAVGILSGAVTSTPAMVAAQQTVLDLNPTALEASHNVGAAYAVGYPFSILSVFVAVMLLMKMFPSSVKRCSGRSGDKYTAVETVFVSNPSVFDKTVRDIVSESGFHFVISRVWRDGVVQIPMSDTVIRQGDRLMLICDKEDIIRFADVFGKKEDKDWNLPDIDWNIIDKNLVSRHLRVTRESVLGVSLSHLKLRNKFGVNITRINRAGITIIPSADTVLQLGDRLTVVGDEEKIKAMGKAVGNEEKRLDSPRLIPILLGIFLGVFLGSIPVAIPGMSAPLKLGIAGGPIIVGILMGAFGPRFHIQTYTTRAANLMLREMGITFFFASLGFSVGGSFAETVFSSQGLKWALASVSIAFLPIFIMGIVNEKFLKIDFARSVGCLCGSAANPNVLNYSIGCLESDTPAESYATVYPVVTFLRIFIAQTLIIILGV